MQTQGIHCERKEDYVGFEIKLIFHIPDSISAPSTIMVLWKKRIRFLVPIGNLKYTEHTE